MTHSLGWSVVQKIQNSMEWSTSQRNCVSGLHQRRCRGKCWLLFEDAFWEGNKSVSNTSVMKWEALTIETVFWHLEGKKIQCYNVMVVDMTTPAHLITLLSANDSKLTMCWQLGTCIHQGNGNIMESSIKMREATHPHWESSDWVLSDGKCDRRNTVVGSLERSRRWRNLVCYWACESA